MGTCVETNRKIIHQRLAKIEERGVIQILTKNITSTVQRIQYRCLSCKGLFTTPLSNAVGLKHGCPACSNRATNLRVRLISEERRLVRARKNNPGITIHRIYRQKKDGVYTRHWYTVFDCVDCGMTTENLTFGRSEKICPRCVQNRSANSKTGLTYGKFLISGREFNVQGYEAVILQKLLDAGTPADKILSSHKTPVFKYHDGKLRTYLPDFSVGHTICEVKSLFTLGFERKHKIRHNVLRRVKLKAKAVLASGYKFALFVCIVDHGREKSIRLSKEWIDFKPSDLRRYIQERFADLEFTSLDIRLPRF